MTRTRLTCLIFALILTIGASMPAFAYDAPRDPMGKRFISWVMERVAELAAKFGDTIEPNGFQGSPKAGDTLEPGG